MAFWGVEVKSGKPVTLDYDSERGRLHLTQATLGLGSSDKKSVVQCNVGDGPGILLCSLLPEKTEACSLNLQFEEEEEVTFSVLGPRSVHLTGYYMSPNRERHNDSDTSGEDITGDTEDSEDFSDDDEYEEDFIDDDMIVSTRAHNSGVRIEEIEDEEPKKEHILKKKKKDERQQKAIFPVNGAIGDSKSISDIDKNESGQKLIEEADHISESEDGDGFPIGMKKKRGENDQAGSLPKDEAIEGNSGDATDPSKLTAPDVTEEGKLSGKKKKKLKKKGNKSEMEKISRNANNDLLEETKQMLVPSDEMEEGMKSGQKLIEEANHISESEDGDGFPIGIKRKRGESNWAESPLKDEAREGNSGDATVPSKLTGPDVTEEGKSSRKKKKKLKKKGNKNEMENISRNANDGLLEETEQMLVPSDKMEEEMKHGNNVRTFPNGLVVEELSMGKPDGKKAAPGSKVAVYYTGKLKKNGKIFDSNIGRKPFKFRLGVGDVISGWDVGVKGMRVGDKRRLTIPPAMGYGAAGAGQIPGNAWLVFDVELVDA